MNMDLARLVFEVKSVSDYRSQESGTLVIRWIIAKK